MSQDAELNALLKQDSHLRFWEIWQNGQSGFALDDEQARIYHVMLEHPEHADLWEHLDRASDNEIMQDGVDLVLHITFHSIIENQLAENNPPAVRQVLMQLLGKGMGRHEAVHLLANAFIVEFFRMMRDQQVYNEANYLRELRKLPLSIPDQRKRKK